MYTSADDLIDICTLITKTFEVRVSLYNEENELIHDTLSERTSPFKQPQFSAFGKNTYEVVSINSVEQFLSFHLKNTERTIGTFIIGPVVNPGISDQAIQGLKNDGHVTADHAELKKYVHSLPVMNQSKLLGIAKWCHYILFRELIDPDIFGIQRKEIVDTMNEDETNLEIFLAENRQNFNYHHTYSAEKEILSYVKDGNKEELLRKKVTFLDGGSPGVLSRNSYIRSEKNLAIALITLATRAAMEGGLNPELAYTLSDLYIQKLEETSSIDQIRQIKNDTLLDLTDRVRKVKNNQYSKAVKQSINYIFKHIYEEITLDLLAHEAGISSTYLSKQFKKEAGITISEYIHAERISEAKKLLTYSSFTITEIATLLKFYDQSYFTRVFKKHTGLTPKKYTDSTHVE